MRKTKQMSEITSELNVSATEQKVANKPKVLQAKVEKLLPLSKDDSAKRTFKIVSKRVAEVSYSFTHDSKDRPRYQVTTTLDFSSCTDEEILELASKPVVIKLQDERRKMSLPDAIASQLHNRVDVKSEIERERKNVDPHERSIRSLMNSLGVTYDVAQKKYAALLK